MVNGTVLAVPLNTVTMYTNHSSSYIHKTIAFITHETSVSYDNIRDFDQRLLHQLEEMKAQTD